MVERDEIEELHWLITTLQTVDVGLVVVNRDYRVELWNGFMENHSNLSSSQTLRRPLFELFPELPRDWLAQKIETVFLLNTRVFCSWEQRPYLFRFKAYRPITGGAEWMYQNITLMPVTGTDAQVSHVCILIYDVTDIALSKLQLKAANQELARLSEVDGLTGLYNRRSWEERLAGEFRRAKRTGEVCSLVMLDIDHFKRVNDTYGHQAGDEVIRALSRALQARRRETDIAGRYGGEEFGVILVGTDARGSLCFTEDLRRRVEADLVGSDAGEIRYTISLGIAEFDPHDAGHAQWIVRADRALYHSKENGRNRSTVFGARLGS